MLYTQTLFIPITILCTDKSGYEKVQTQISDFVQHSKLCDNIIKTFGLDKIDNNCKIYPIMQLYNPEDYYNRNICSNTEIIIDSINYSNKKLHNKQKLCIIHTSTGKFPEEINPIHKPLNEISGVKNIIINNEIKENTSFLLFFLMPIVIAHNNQEILEEAIDFILDYEFNEELLYKLSVCFSEYYDIKEPNIMIAYPINHIDFLGDTYESISECLEEEIEKNKPEPYVNDLKGINRNDFCPCGSGKKYKKCCIYKLN